MKLHERVLKYTIAEVHVSDLTPTEIAQELSSVAVTLVGSQAKIAKSVNKHNTYLDAVITAINDWREHL